MAQPERAALTGPVETGVPGVAAEDACLHEDDEGACRFVAAGRFVGGAQQEVKDRELTGIFAVAQAADLAEPVGEGDQARRLLGRQVGLGPGRGVGFAVGKVG